MRSLVCVLAVALFSGTAIFRIVQTSLAEGPQLPNLFPFPNANGLLQTFNINGDIDLNNPFFQSLGTNGRTCASCHQPDQGWTISAERVRERFEASEGLDPIFRTNDGSNCDHDIDVATEQGRKEAYSLLISKGLIRIALPVPTTVLNSNPVTPAEFEVVGVSNPYGCNETNTLSTYRRPLPSTNLKFISAVMWDGRESTPPSTEKITIVTNPNDLRFDLAHQSLDATNGHAQGTGLSSLQQQQIVDFETGLFTAQAVDEKAGALSAQGGRGGPVSLATQQFFIGVNDPLGHNLFSTAFSPIVFTLFDAWSNLPDSAEQEDAKETIARGQTLFNSKPINITGVAGLNDGIPELNNGIPVPSIAGTCGTCHDSPNIGNHSFPAPLNIGVGDLANPLGVNYLPVITLRNKSTGAIVQTTDAGRAMITGLWKDIGRMKGPILRGLASRAPYFHNGSASTLKDVVEFYDQRFAIGLTSREKTDLVAFLNSL